MAVPLTNSHSVPYHRIDCITVPLTFGIRQDAMLLSPVATDIRFCNLTLYNGLVGLRLNRILQHKEMMFRAPRGLGSSQRSERSGTSEISEVLSSSKEVLLFQAFRVGDQLSEAPGAKVCLIELSEVLAFVKNGLLYKLLEWGTCF